jgi:hypothetical protein
VSLGPPATVLTASALSDVYGVRVEVIERDGTLLVVPLREDHPRG